MAKIIFWEKPGCKGNSRQKQLLLASGHQLEVRNLLSESWTETELARFFGDRPVAEWFNLTNPRVKAGELIPAEIPAAAALKMMIVEPLLIVRPLLQVGQQRLAGFDVQQVHNWIGLALDEIGPLDPQHCPCVTTADLSL
jgi:nitrogenase-associated protein